MKYLLSVLCLIILLPLAAINAAKVFADLEKSYEQITTFEAEFTQHNHWQELDTSLMSKGIIAYDKRNLLLSYTEPPGQKMLVEGTDISVYDTNAKQLYITSATGQNQQIRPINIIRYYWDISSHTVSANDSVYIMELIPSDDAQVNTIKAKIDKKTMLIKEISYTDNAENTVTYVFSHLKLNKMIDKSIFNLNIPDDTNVIDQRSKD